MITLDCKKLAVDQFESDLQIDYDKFCAAKIADLKLQIYQANEKLKIATDTVNRLTEEYTYLNDEKLKELYFEKDIYISCSPYESFLRGYNKVDK
jgi:hypothetical protein